MPIVDHAARLITCTLVFVGPAQAGKATNLTWLHAALPSGQVGPLTSVATRNGRTHAFDYRPDELPALGAFAVGFHLRSTTGMAHRGNGPETLLDGADGIAFIADGHRDRLSDNLTSFRDLQRRLAHHMAEPLALPLVVQCNKQDLPADMRIDLTELRDQLGVPSLAIIPAQATTGEGVRETVQTLSTMVLAHLGASADTPRWAA